jgi:hypothetical protein
LIYLKQGSIEAFRSCLELIIVLQDSISLFEKLNQPMPLMLLNYFAASNGVQGQNKDLHFYSKLHQMRKLALILHLYDVAKVR